MINRQLKFAEAIHEAIDICLERDRSTYLMGLGVPDPIVVFGTTTGLQEKHGKKRTPLPRPDLETTALPDRLESPEDAELDQVASAGERNTVISALSRPLPTLYRRAPFLHRRPRRSPAKSRRGARDESLDGLGGRRRCGVRHDALHDGAGREDKICDPAGFAYVTANSFRRRGDPLPGWFFHGDVVRGLSEAGDPIRAWKEINMRVLHRVVLGVASLGLVAFSVQPARAADGDITAGYSYLYDSDSSTGLPAGWFLSAGAHLTETFAVVGDISGRYKSQSVTSGGVTVNASSNIYTFLAGPRVVGHSGPLGFYGQFLVGAARASAGASANGAGWPSITSTRESPDSTIWGR